MFAVSEYRYRHLRTDRLTTVGDRDAPDGAVVEVDKR